jgi:GPH family glycoside/pentoside/hexuronide:cation symporter
MSSLSATVRHGYGVAALSLSLCNATLLFFLTKFLLDEAGLAPVTAAVVVMVGKLWDAVSDPIVGSLSDRTRSPMGARRPWVLVGSLPCMLLFVCLWQPLPLEGTAQAVAIGALLIAYNTAYTAVVVPYGALTPALTSDYDERTRLNAARMGWSMLGGIVVGVVVPLLQQRTGTYATGAMVLGIVGLVPLWVSVWATAGLDRAPTRTATPASMWSVMGNRAFRRTAVLFLAAWVCIAVLSAMVPFYAEHHLGLPDAVDGLFAAIQISAMVSIPLVDRLAARTEKHVAYAVCLLAWGAVMVGFSTVPPGARGLALTAAVLAGPGVAAAHVLPWSMLPDVVEADAAEHGEERAGAFYGVMTFLEKVGTALALNGMLLALGAAGYVSAGAEQPASAVLAIRWLIGPVPGAVLLAAAVYAWLRPPMTRQRHRELAA